MRLLFRALRVVYFAVVVAITGWITYIKLLLNGVTIEKGSLIKGIPLIYIHSKGKFTIGKNFYMQSGRSFNMIGGQYKCSFVVENNAELRIGDNVGISNAAIVCHKKITIHDNVKIGGSVKIYDTNFHSLNAMERNNVPEIYNVATSDVVIKSGAFIGAHSIILRGTVIGENVIIGAGSVVRGKIPPNEIWAGNPARFIKSVQ